jgi:hypothetical protein
MVGTLVTKLTAPHDYADGPTPGRTALRVSGKLGAIVCVGMRWVPAVLS